MYANVVLILPRSYHVTASNQRRVEYISRFTPHRNLSQIISCFIFLCCSHRKGVLPPGLRIKPNLILIYGWPAGRPTALGSFCSLKAEIYGSFSRRTHTLDMHMYCNKWVKVWFRSANYNSNVQTLVGEACRSQNSTLLRAHLICWCNTQM